MNRSLAAIAVVLLLLCSQARAVSDPAEMLSNPVLEHRAEAIGDQLRCLVCQNETVEQSDADLARDFRRIIRQRVVAGDTNQQVIAWMVSRYGDFIRLRPPFEPRTLLLWGSPLIALAIAAAAIAIGRRHRAAAPEPLSAAEQRRLADLLK